MTRRCLAVMLRVSRKLALFGRSEHGGSMFELALVMGLIFLPLLFGFFEYGRVVFSKSTVTTSAREGVRWAIVRGSTSGNTTNATGVENYVKGITAIAPISVTTTWEDASKKPLTAVTVSVSYAYQPLVPFIPSRTITSASRQIIAY